MAALGFLLFLRTSPPQDPFGWPAVHFPLERPRRIPIPGGGRYRRRLGFFLLSCDLFQEGLDLAVPLRIAQLLDEF